VGAFHWTVCAILGALSVLILLCNWGGTVRAIRTGRNYSWVPLLGGLFGMAACLTCPWPAVRPWAWVPLVVDVSVGLFPLGLIFILVSRRTGRSAADKPKR
jgi:hypothetical protein